MYVLISLLSSLWDFFGTKLWVFDTLVGTGLVPGEGSRKDNARYELQQIFISLRVLVLCNVFSDFCDWAQSILIGPRNCYLSGRRQRKVRHGRRTGRGTSGLVKRAIYQKRKAG